MASKDTTPHDPDDERHSTSIFGSVGTGRGKSRSENDDGEQISNADIIEAVKDIDGKVKDIDGEVKTLGKAFETLKNKDFPEFKEDIRTFLHYTMTLIAVGIVVTGTVAALA